MTAAVSAAALVHTVAAPACAQTAADAALRIEAGDDGKASIVARGRGAALGVPAPPSLASPLSVQLHTDSGSVCWSAAYSFPPALKRTDEIFKDRSD